MISRIFKISRTLLVQIDLCGSPALFLVMNLSTDVYIYVRTLQSGIPDAESKSARKYDLGCFFFRSRIPDSNPGSSTKH
jgi:hypothetical protein